MAGVSPLPALVERHMLAPFDWRRDHCVAAVGRVLRDLGHDVPEELFCGVYSGEDEAVRARGPSLAETARRAARELSWPEIDPARARDADVGVRGQTLAIRCGSWWVAKSERGYALYATVDRAWRPGRPA